MSDRPAAPNGTAPQWTDWRRLREFRGVDLTESFVLSWRLERNALELDVDLCLLPEHVLYEAPRASERACWRAALLVFPDCTAVRRIDGASAPADTGAAVAALGHGRISGLRRIHEGGYEIGGRFGCVEVRSGRPLVRIVRD